MTEPIIVSQTGKGTYQSISRAIKAAPPRGQILIRPGHYKEHIIIDKPLFLRGDGPAEEIIIESANAPCLLMKSAYAEVRRVTFSSESSKRRKAFTVDIPQGRLTLEECRIIAPTRGGIGVYGPNTRPIIKRCQIYHGRPVGIRFWKQAGGELEACEIVGSQTICLEIKQGANPTIRRCKIYDSGQTGIYVRGKTSGIIEDCEIALHAMAGVEVREGGNPILRRCIIRDGKQYGVFVCQEGRGTFDDCHIFGHTVGATIILEGNPHFRRCRINHNRHQAFRIYMNGGGLIEDCDLTNNRRGAWHIEEKMYRQSKIKKDRNIE